MFGHSGCPSCPKFVDELGQAANVSVAAESFAVDAVIEPDPKEAGLHSGGLVHLSTVGSFG